MSQTKLHTDHSSKLSELAHLVTSKSSFVKKKIFGRLQNTTNQRKYILSAIPRGRTAGECNEKFIGRRNHCIRSDGEPELPEQITPEAIGAVSSSVSSTAASSNRGVRRDHGLGNLAFNADAANTQIAAARGSKIGLDPIVRRLMFLLIVFSAGIFVPVATRLAGP
ncbi:cullin 1 [Striga asiatica]|uniref:Cullin 1 n=1 Tax=Striga asiatica TaxID=4170 RepID=A0A5A7R5H0_STRAF|nr:cullin 1 [Striga asiatica]